MLSSHEKGYLAKQGISYEDHKANMIALSDIDNLKMATAPCWNIGVEDLLMYAKRDFERYGSEKFQNAVDYYEAVLDNRAPKLDIICFEDDLSSIITPKPTKFKQLSLEVA